jgi:hypothetical protein
MVMLGKTGGRRQNHRTQLAAPPAGEALRLPACVVY